MIKLIALSSLLILLGNACTNTCLKFQQGYIYTTEENSHPTAVSVAARCIEWSEPKP